MGQAMALIAVAFGAAFVISGLGLLWVGMARKEPALA
jgi:hypothetical protein